MDASTRIEGAVVGSIVGLSPKGDPLVDYPGNPSGPASARTTLPIDPRQLGSGAVLVFEEGDPAKPIVVGILRARGRAPRTVEVGKEGEALVFTAEREIVLRCGKASITLTKEGKVILRGAYVSTRSSGVNRIQGGSVQIN